MFRLYNPYSGEHFYTASTSERDSVVKAGWNYEGIGWVVPVRSNTPVYRLSSGTDHHYTMDAKERDSLVRVGWKYEGVGWYSDDAKGVPLYCQFNPYVNPHAGRNNSGLHNYTVSKAENDSLVRLGWRDEGVGWYGVKGAAFSAKPSASAKPSTSTEPSAPATPTKPTTPTKPVTQDRLDFALERAFSKVEEASNGPVRLHDGRVERMVSPDSILYVESDRRVLWLHTAEGVFRTYGRLKDAASTLPARFIQPHRGYLVNMDHIEELGAGGAEDPRGGVVPVSQRRAKAVREALAAYLGRSIG